jgi:hypothetical protein
VNKESCKGRKGRRQNGSRKEQQSENSKNDEKNTGYIHVRARRGQATDSHSLAERVMPMFSLFYYSYIKFFLFFFHLSFTMQHLVPTHFLNIFSGEKRENKWENEDASRPCPGLRQGFDLSSYYNFFFSIFIHWKSNENGENKLRFSSDVQTDRFN